jgi:hypothetical protein
MPAAPWPNPMPEDARCHPVAARSSAPLGILARGQPPMVPAISAAAPAQRHAPARAFTFLPAN